ncbi:9583_t:CDS:1, partial [Cetraspora pellucida]
MRGPFEDWSFPRLMHPYHSFNFLEFVVSYKQKDYVPVFDDVKGVSCSCCGPLLNLPD